MHLWLTRVVMVRPMAAFPSVQTVCSEEQYGEAYRHFGRFRQKERHYLFKYTLSGVGIFRDAAGEHEVGAGRGFLCEISDPATAYYYPPRAVVPWRFVWITFTGEAAACMVRALVGRYGGVYGIAPEHEAIQRLMDFRRHAGLGYLMNSGESAEIVLSLLSALASSKESRSDDKPGPELVLRAQDYLGAHMEEEVNVSDLARRIGVSREHLSRAFREQTGTTPHAYIVRRKVRHACRILRESTLSNKEVAQRLGYSSPAHFARSFKRLVGMTPSRFRAAGIGTPDL